MLSTRNSLFYDFYDFIAASHYIQSRRHIQLAHSLNGFIGCHTAHPPDEDA